MVMLVAACGDDGRAEDGGQGAPSTTIATSSTTASSTADVPGDSTSSSVDEPEPVEEISVFFGTGDPDVCEAVAPHARAVPTVADPVRFAFDELVAGPTDRERAEGAFSFFSAETAGGIRSVTSDGQRLVVDVVDLRDVLTPAGANTSCGSAAQLGELNATAFQFPSVASVRYELEGSCDRFGEWLQRGCIEVGRADWADGVAAQLPGEAFDGVLPPGAVLAVIGVAADGQLNVRALPGVDRPVLAAPDQLTAEANGHARAGR
ncbi:MAG: hypothetical protein AAGA99_13110 [Actinomycetota bacterium]